MPPTTPTRSNHETVIYEHISALLIASPFQMTLNERPGEEPVASSKQLGNFAWIRFEVAEELQHDMKRPIFALPVNVSLCFLIARNIKTLHLSRETSRLFTQTLQRAENLLSGEFHRGRVEYDKTDEKTTETHYTAKHRFLYHCAGSW